MTVSVYISICLSVCYVFVCLRVNLWNHTSGLHQIFVHVTYDHGSVLLLRIVIRYAFPVL